MLGKVYYKLGLMSDAEKQLLSSIKNHPFVNSILQLCLYININFYRIYQKIDQPLKALEILNKAANENIGESYFIIYQARIKELIGDYEASISLYKNVLLFDNCNFEAIACIGSNHFYNDQPEIALKFYKRLFELGINSCEIWNNLGLCAYYAGQYDFTLR